jgi:hypothetical protein
VREITELRITSNLDKLTKLYLSDTRQLPASEIIKLLESAPNLEEIDITDSKEPELILEWITKSKHFTKTLYVKNGSKVTEIKEPTNIAEPSNKPAKSTIDRRPQLK